MININIDTNKIIKNQKKLRVNTTSFKMLVESFKTILRFDKSNVIHKIIFLIIEVIIAYITSTQTNTIELTFKVCEIIITVIIALLAIVFTGYVFFQALINDKLLIALLNEDDEDSKDHKKNKGSLVTTNNYLITVMLYYVACIILDMLVLIFTTIIPENWSLPLNNTANVAISFLCIVGLLHLNFEIILETRNVIFNIYQLFNLHAAARANEIVERFLAENNSNVVEKNQHIKEQ